jgi:hypothetical protein
MIYIFFAISRSFLLIIRNVSDKLYRENQNTQPMFSNIFFFENFEIMWKNIDQPVRPQMTKWRMRIASWILNTRNTHISICNSYSFSTATMLAPVSLSVFDTYIGCIVD